MHITFKNTNENSPEIKKKYIYLRESNSNYSYPKERRLTSEPSSIKLINR